MTHELLPTEHARQLAAQAWCTPATSAIEMDVRLADAFAFILDKVADELERTRVQLAGCGVAAMGNTRETLALNKEVKQGDYGWSASYGDCLRAAEREIELRAALSAQDLGPLRELVLAAIPSNWLDPLLSGATKFADPPYSCRDVEVLLQGIRERITAALANLPAAQTVTDEDWKAIAKRRGHELRDLMDTCAGKELRIVAAENACKKMREKMLDVFTAGWHLCAKWAKRDDLHFDVDSPAYKRDRQAALTQFLRGRENRS